MTRALLGPVHQRTSMEAENIELASSQSNGYNDSEERSEKA